MKRITFRLAVAFLTFIVGLTSAAVWLWRATPPAAIEETPSSGDSGGSLPPEMAAALRGIPLGWQKSLVERLNLFTTYQRTGRWDEVAELLGEFKGVPGRDPFTAEQKRGLIERLRERPILGFRPRCTLFSTEILGRPFEQRWWQIKGAAESSEGGLRVETSGEIIAYRHQGNWFFYPTGGDASACHR